MFLKLKKLNTSLMFIFFLFLVGELVAQQVPIYSQYMFNKFILNPAVAGSEGYTAYNVTSRVQWLGFKDAPVTNSISAQTRLVKSKFHIWFRKKREKYDAPEEGTIGLGAHLYYDHRGILDQTGVQFTYAYHEKIDLKEQLSFGLSISATQFTVNTSKMISYQQDNYLNSNKFSIIIPDFNFGIYYSSTNSYLGFSISQLMQSTIRIGNYEDNKFRLYRNYNIMGGYRFKLNNELAIEPSFQFKTTELFFYQIDAGCRLYYYRDFWGGISFRTGGALIFTLGTRYNNLFLGYAYDVSFNKLQTYSFGTHELIISLKFKENERKYKWMERF
jgi:type IX secretion system PorP/SprF family membrane protein